MLHLYSYLRIDKVVYCKIPANVYNHVNVTKIFIASTLKVTKRCNNKCRILVKCKACGIFWTFSKTKQCKFDTNRTNKITRKTYIYADICLLWISVYQMKNSMWDFEKRQSTSAFFLICISRNENFTEFHDNFVKVHENFVIISLRIRLLQSINAVRTRRSFCYSLHLILTLQPWLLWRLRTSHKFLR